MQVPLALRLTALTLLLRPMGPWTVRPLILLCAGVALLSPRALLRPLTWYALAALIALRIAADWPVPDNHVYLLAYWCLAVALALGATDRELVIVTSGRLLIGSAFLLAVLWKGALSTDYLDGRFFRVTWLTDDRFSDTVQLLGGLSQPQLDHNRDVLKALPEGAELLHPPALEEPRAFRQLVLVSTWGMLVVESLIAATFLLPLGRRLSFVRHPLLLSFCVVTYAIAPVAGFGWLLLTMGVALCRREQRALRATYVATWFLVLLYSEVPWASLAIGWLGGRSD
ncbi:MAG TPA: hypothetical protein VGF24_10855 [Vicinamibacterales bacterium]